MLSRLRSAVQNPYVAYLRGKAKINPGSLVERYADLARRQGFKKLYFTLSFDCDTEEDRDVAWDVHARLMDMGITPVYAICGDLLRDGEKVYSRIFETGAEFINHGDRRHTYFNEEEKAFRPCFFYHQQALDVVEKDIRDADQSIQDVLGIKPKGFRAPHFGTFHKAEQLDFIYNISRDLDYDFCTTTCPFQSFRTGPAAQKEDLYEFPVSGRGSDPLTILDTWSSFINVEEGQQVDYYEEAQSAAAFYQQAEAGLLNYYADPSHVAGNEDFFKAVQLWLEIAEPVSYSGLAERL